MYIFFRIKQTHFYTSAIRNEDFLLKEGEIYIKSKNLNKNGKNAWTFLFLIKGIRDLLRNG